MCWEAVILEAKMEKIKCCVCLIGEEEMLVPCFGQRLEFSTLGRRVRLLQPVSGVPWVHCHEKRTRGREGVVLSPCGGRKRGICTPLLVKI